MKQQKKCISLTNKTVIENLKKEQNASALIQIMLINYYNIRSLPPTTLEILDNNKKPISIRIGPKLLKKVDRIAEVNGINRSQLINNILEMVEEKNSPTPCFNPGRDLALERLKHSDTKIWGNRGKHKYKETETVTF